MCQDEGSPQSGMFLCFTVKLELQLDMMFVCSIPRSVLDSKYCVGKSKCQSLQLSVHAIRLEFENRLASNFLLVELKFTLAQLYPCHL